MKHLVLLLTLIATLLLASTVAAQDWNEPIPACTSEQFAQLNAALDKPSDDASMNFAPMRDIPDVFQELFYDDETEWTDFDLIVAGYASFATARGLFDDLEDDYPYCMYTYHLLRETGILFDFVSMHAYLRREGLDRDLYPDLDAQFDLVREMYENIPTE